MASEIVCKVNEFGLVCGYTDDAVVRCRDCKGYRPGEPCGWCGTHMTAIPREDGFCAWGIPADSDEELSNRGLDEGRKE